MATGATSPPETAAEEQSVRTAGGRASWTDSVHRVIKALTEGPMTNKQIVQATGLPRRTVYTALQKLRGMGLLVERGSLRDTRQTVMWVRRPVPAGE